MYSERRGQVQDKAMSKDEVRDGVELTNLDQSLFEGANATKRDLVEYLDAVSGRIIPGLTNRPLSVIRVLRGPAPFMQKNLPKYTPEWIPKAPLWAETSKREVLRAVAGGGCIGTYNSLTLAMTHKSLGSLTSYWETRHVDLFDS